MIEKCYVNRKQNGTHTFPCSFVLFACLHRGIPKVFLALAFCFVFFLRREVTTFFRALLCLYYIRINASSHLIPLLTKTWRVKRSSESVRHVQLLFL